MLAGPHDAGLTLKLRKRSFFPMLGQFFGTHRRVKRDSGYQIPHRASGYLDNTNQSDYCMCFVEGFAKIASPLHKFKGKGGELELNDPQFVLDTDANDAAVRGALARMGKEERVYVIAHASLYQTGHSSATQCELFPILTMSRHFRNRFIAKKHHRELISWNSKGKADSWMPHHADQALKKPVMSP